MKINTIKKTGNKIIIVDQTLLPVKLKYVEIKTPTQMYHAIKTLMVRGAPAIGIAGGAGIYLGIRDKKFKNTSELISESNKVAKYIMSSRPTAVNLFWAGERILKLINANKNLIPEKIKNLVSQEIDKMILQDNEICTKIGEHGNNLLQNGDTILTHCNAGGLATASVGTALAPIYVAHKKGKKIKVYADETRPLLQGARLTAYELDKNGIDVTLICDNMTASVMAKGKIDCVIVGADRIVANGDFANKIGTFGVAVLAKYHKIPFYVAAPISTFDFKSNSGKQIPIEERNSDEIRFFLKSQCAPKNIKTYNPAFDVTPNKLVTAFITEVGFIYPPFKKNIKKLDLKKLPHPPQAVPPLPSGEGKERIRQGLKKVGKKVK